MERGTGYALTRAWRSEGLGNPGVSDCASISSQFRFDSNRFRPRAKGGVFRAMGKRKNADSGMILDAFKPHSAFVV